MQQVLNMLRPFPDDFKSIYRSFVDTFPLTPALRVPFAYPSRCP